MKNMIYKQILLLFSVIAALMLFLAQASMAADADIIDLTKPPITPTPLDVVTYSDATADPNNPTTGVNLATINQNSTYRCIDPNGTKYTEQIVECFYIPIKKAVLDPVNGLLAKFSIYMSELVAALVVLAIAIFGIKLLGGDPNIGGQAIGLLLKIGIMLFIANNLAGYGGALFDIFDEVVAMGIPGETVIQGKPVGFNPWVMIDTFLGELLGFPTLANPGIDIKNGILGLLEGSLFAKSLGVMITILGGFTIFSLLLFVFQAVYLYLSSVLAVAFLIIISPILFPFMIFSEERGGRFLYKWVDLFLVSMITPMLTFAFLWVFMGDYTTLPTVAAATDDKVSRGIFRSITDDIFYKLNPSYTPTDPNSAKAINYMDNCLQMNQPLFSQMALPTEANAANFVNLKSTDPTDNFSLTSSTQPFIDPNQQKAFEYGIFNRRVAILNCQYLDADISAAETAYLPVTVNPGDPALTVHDKLVIDLLELLFFAILMNSMLSKIPTISQDLARGVTTGVTDLVSPLTRMINYARR